MKKRWFTDVFFVMGTFDASSLQLRKSINTRRRCATTTHAQQSQMLTSSFLQAQAQQQAQREDEASLLLQNAWRRRFRFRQTHQVVEQYLKDGPTVSMANTIRSVGLFVLCGCVPVCLISFACPYPPDAATRR
jgi:hypothetical protein